MLKLRHDGNDLIVKVYIQPRSAKNELAGYFQDALKIRLTAAPVEGEANEACRVFLAEKLGISKSRVKIISGLTNRHKQVKILGLTDSQFKDILSREGICDLRQETQGDGS
ncbi:MAG TPA: hypothetical protein DEH07_07345, partial [Desulfotomaculum sp.]|nr:hypothetical protein [Desulfotomaculum sp.]